MNKIKTLTDENFETEVLSSTETVMVDFGAAWCGPCKILEPVLEKVAAEASFKVFKVDIDDSPDISKKYGVRGVPTILVFKNGEVVKRNVGVATKDVLLKLGSI